MENEKQQELKPRNNPTTKLSTEGYSITREQRLGYAKKKEKERNPETTADQCPKPATNSNKAERIRKGNLVRT